MYFVFDVYFSLTNARNTQHDHPWVHPLFAMVPRHFSCVSSLISIFCLYGALEQQRVVTMALCTRPHVPD